MTDQSPTAPPLPMGVVLASFGARTGGWFVDQAVAGVPVFLVFLMLGKTAEDMSEGSTWLWFNIAFLGLGLLHETVGVWRWGRTVGKWICRIKVVHVADGGSVTLSSAFLRSLVPAAFGVIPTVGSLLGMGVLWWAFFDPRRQGIHDKAAGTLVARNDRFGTRFSRRG